MTPNRPLSTADLAATDDVRSHHRDEIRDTDMPLSSPAEAAANQPPVDRTRVRAQDPAPHAPLFAERDLSGLRDRWSDVQAGFVDEPRRAVEQADSLVAEVMKRLAESFAAERATLEKQWDHGDNVTTEDLRLALQRYRSFFDRLLTV
jgi:hypothetical protein